MNAHRVYSMKGRSKYGIICDQLITLDGFYTSKGYPEQLRRIRFKDPETGKTLVFLTNNTALPALTIAALYKQRWQVELFSNGSAASAYQAVYRQQRERGETQIWCASPLTCWLPLLKRNANWCLALHFATDIVVFCFRENPISQASQGWLHFEHDSPPNQLNLFDI